MNAGGKVVKTWTYKGLKPSIRLVKIALSAGRYKFKVAAVNKVGTGAYSAYSNVVRAR